MMSLFFFYFLGGIAIYALCPFEKAYRTSFFPPWDCEGFFGSATDTPGPYSRIRLALPSSGSTWHRNRVKSGNRCRIDVESMPSRPLRRAGRGRFEGGVGACAKKNPHNLRRHIAHELPCQEHRSTGGEDIAEMVSPITVEWATQHEEPEGAWIHLDTYRRCPCVSSEIANPPGWKRGNLWFHWVAPTDPSFKRLQEDLHPNLLWDLLWEFPQNLLLSYFWLRGPAAILFISRDTCRDSIARVFGACFYGISHSYRAIRCKMGIAQMCLCETKYQWRVSHHFGGVLTSLRKYRAIWGIAAIVS